MKPQLELIKHSKVAMVLECFINFGRFRVAAYFAAGSLACSAGFEGVGLQGSDSLHTAKTKGPDRASYDHTSSIACFTCQDHLFKGSLCRCQDCSCQALSC